uniref:ATP-dependent RNA helicase Ski2/MTR4 C-terminal domain-containing protein n=1 Tax=Plectus sambesii TaxID=2011161 RepID=A0A914UWC7_9BILA
MPLEGDVLAVAAKITRVQHDCGVRMSDISEELRFDLIEVVYEWANGVRLNEVCRDVRNAARIVGDPSLQTKMEETSTAIKRDIVFAASLYTVT